jgi:lipopolysaccharide/colanic/teichoic acid biosynthesis glycosyltransferase
VTSITSRDRVWSAGPPDAAAREVLSHAADGFGYRLVRRALDIAVSIAVLALTLPLTALIAVLVKRDSPGPVLFRHRRTGIDRRRAGAATYQGPERRRYDLFGKPFVLYKFRTMYADAHTRFPELYTYRYSSEELATLPIKVLVSTKGRSAVTGAEPDVVDDPRVTRVGRWLRRTSLDELPNLLNVLRGDMHLVGPRPDIAENVRYYSDHHRQKLRVKPGVTGLAQINGRGKLSFVETNEHDVEYVQRRSLSLDVKILFMTTVATLKRDGAF